MSDDGIRWVGSYLDGRANGLDHDQADAWAQLVVSLRNLFISSVFLIGVGYVLYLHFTGKTVVSNPAPDYDTLGGGALTHAGHATASPYDAPPPLAYSGEPSDDQAAQPSAPPSEEAVATAYSACPYKTGTFSSGDKFNLTLDGARVGWRNAATGTALLDPQMIEKLNRKVAEACPTQGPTLFPQADAVLAGDATLVEPPPHPNGAQAIIESFTARRQAAFDLCENRQVTNEGRVFDLTFESGLAVWRNSAASPITDQTQIAGLSKQLATNCPAAARELFGIR